MQHEFTESTDPSTIETEDLLFKHFCNNLYLGQWQLARANIAQIQRIAKDKPILEILKDVSSHPFNRSVLSQAVSSPCHLSWLSLLEYEKILRENKTQALSDKGSPDRELIQFHLLLLDVCPHITDGELKMTLENIVRKGEIAPDEQFLLFPQCFLYYQKILSQYHHILKCRLQTLSLWDSQKVGVW